jgi:hypothetical protein
MNISKVGGLNRLLPNKIKKADNFLSLRNQTNWFKKQLHISLYMAFRLWVQDWYDEIVCATTENLIKE